MTAVLAGFAFVLGAIVGSFLNACIYRMPRGISLSNPKRSFCTSCDTLIPWYLNLPLISWVMLRGKCAKCGASFSVRYFGVELLTGLAFWAVWVGFGLPLAPVYWVFVALLITATFIDFDFFIIPDEITIGGTVAGVVLSTALPVMMGVDGWWQGLAWSLGAAALGYGLLWAVVELGKKAFGRTRHALEPAEGFRLHVDGENPEFELGADRTLWEEIFSRESDAVVMECAGAELEWVEGPQSESQKVSRWGGKGEVRLYYNKVVAGGREVAIEDVRSLTGTATAVVIPREAMGFGDVKFIACIGAFLGWQAVIFTIFASSIVGAVVGGGALLLSGGKAGSKIPYGPYLALGAVLWLAVGPAAVRWYFGLFQPGVLP